MTAAIARFLLSSTSQVPLQTRSSPPLYLPLILDLLQEYFKSIRSVSLHSHLIDPPTYLLQEGPSIIEQQRRILTTTRNH